MEYAKADPEIRMLMRAWKAKGVGYVASLAPSKEQESSLVPVLVGMRGGKPPQALQKRPWMRVSSTLWATYLSAPEIETLNFLPQVSHYERAMPLDCSLNETIEALGVLQIEGLDRRDRGSGVIVGIIDTGLDWRQQDFIDENGRSRVLYLWDQTLERYEDDPQFEDPEHNQKNWIGVEYTSQHLTKALTDDRCVVRHTPTPHGTHVTGIAVGNGRSGSYGAKDGEYVGVAPEAGIIFVALKKNDPESAGAAAAVEYIFSKADQLDRPCVINLSMGQNLGGHDGESVLERTIDDHLGRDGRTVVIAAGNQHQPPIHANFSLVEAGAGNLELRIAPDHAATRQTRVQIWHSPVDEVSVQVLCPHPAHEPLHVVVAPFSDTLRTPCKVSVDIDAVRFASDNAESRIRVLIGAHANAAGVWTIRLRGKSIRNGSIDAWIANSGSGVIQPEFIGEGTDGQLRRSVTTPATARRCVTVGNYVTNARKIAAGSGRGTTRDGRPKPDLVAPGDGIMSTRAHGTPQTGVRSPMSGTSMAAPFVAGVVALMFQRNPTLTSWTVRSILKASADRPEDGGDGFGAGTLNARKALELTPLSDKVLAPEDLS